MTTVRPYFLYYVLQTKRCVKLLRAKLSVIDHASNGYFDNEYRVVYRHNINKLPHCPQGLYFWVWRWEHLNNFSKKYTGGCLTDCPIKPIYSSIYN